MSMALFLNVDRQIPKRTLSEISRLFKQRNVTDVAFRHSEELFALEGENYYFDSMWIPFLNPLNGFEDKVDDYEQLVSILKATKEIASFLIDKKYRIKLFLNSVEGGVAIKGREKLKLSDLNAYRSLEWATIYEICE